MRTRLCFLVGCVVVVLAIWPSLTLEAWPPCVPSECGPFIQDPGGGGVGCKTCVLVVTPQGSYERCEPPVVAGRYKEQCRINPDGSCQTYGDTCWVYEA